MGVTVTVAPAALVVVSTQLPGRNVNCTTPLVGVFSATVVATEAPVASEAVTVTPASGTSTPEACVCETTFTDTVREVAWRMIGFGVGLTEPAATTVTANDDAGLS